MKFKVFVTGNLPCHLPIVASLSQLGQCQLNIIKRYLHIFS